MRTRQGESCPACGKFSTGGRAPGVRSRGAVRPALIVATAILVMVGAGVMIAWSVREEVRQWVNRPQPAPSAAPAPSGKKGGIASQGDPGEARSVFTVARAGTGESARSVVMLGRPGFPEDFKNAIGGTDQAILLRELVRQAVLLAARDELGLATRDEVLGEPVRGGQEGQDVEVTSVFREGGKSRATIRKAAGGKSETLLDKPLPEIAMPKVVERVEALSRTELPAALKALGLSGKANAVRADAPLPEGTEERLSRLNHSDVFAAVRDLHAAIRADGESPARVASLARGYALLGVLTEYQWAPAHKVFKARALLYAQRLVAPDADDPFALWNRAFVRALVGMHAGARADLIWAQKQAGGRPGQTPMRPDWVSLVDAYLRYDVKHLRTDHEAQQGLAALLRLLAIEFPWLRGPTMKASQEILVRDPDCFRAVDAVCQAGGLGDLHTATTLGPEVLARTVPRKIRALKSLPASVGEVIDRQTAAPALEEALRKAGEPGEDGGEPSWSVLGHLVAEARFVQVWRRLDFMRNKWAVPVDEYWAEARPTIAGHRDLPFLEAMTLPSPQATARLAGFLKTIDLSDLEVTEVRMEAALKNLPDARSALPWVAAVVHHDALARDLAEVCYQSGQAPKYARNLLRLSGHSTFARAVLIEKDWEFAKTHLPQWEKDPATADSPAMLAALARRYTEMGRADDARLALQRYIKQSPDYWSYDMLAENARARGDLKQFRATLEEFLELGEDSGLDDARARVKLANDLMSRQQWEEAKPYAEAAAATWAGWAMECAGQCNEGLGDFARAESWFKLEAERYPRSYMQWFLFCKRTGRGDVAAAAQHAVNYVERAGDGLTENEKGLSIFLFDLSSNPARGVKFIQSLHQSPPAQGTPGGRLARWIEQMFLAQFADAVDNRTLRDETWAQVAKGDHPAAAKVAALFAAGPAREFDRKAFDALLESTDPVARSFLGYFAGRFLQRLGKVVDAAYYLDRYSSTIPGGNTFVWLLADSALRDLLKGDIPADPHLLVVRAAYHRKDNRPDLALKDLDEAIRIDPKNAEAFNLRGRVKRKADDFDGALADFNKLVELSPENPLGRLGRGFTYLLQGKDEEASKDFDQLVSQSHDSGIGQLGRGLLAFAQGRETDADSEFGQALKLDKGLAQEITTLKRTVTQQRKPKAR